MDRFTDIQNTQRDRLSIALYYFILGALIIGTFLSVLSALEICTSACAAGHQYRLYGFKFESVGLLFFLSTVLFHAYSQRYNQLNTLVVLMLSAAVGAEGMFIYAQKYIIGSWCPICLAIATTVIMAFLASLISLFRHNQILSLKRLKGDLMKHFIFSTGSLALMAFGFFFADFGFAKFNQVQAAEKTIKEQIAFGNIKSPIEVYVFTDWECPACRKIEPVIEKGSQEIMEQAKLFFIDFTIHNESLDFTPYNLAFMVHNKSQYFPLRDGLIELSESDEPPTEEQIEALAKKQKTKYTPINFSEVTVATNFYSQIAKQFKVDSTPTVVIVNSKTKKGKKLLGSNEITLANIQSAIEALKE